MDRLDLLDWKRRIFALYADVRAELDPVSAWTHWRDVRSELYRTHPQSPRVGGDPVYYDYDPALRFEGEVRTVELKLLEIPGSAGSVTRFTRFAVARFDMHELELYWLDAYGGGIFLPFGDRTNSDETYGAGRYLLDTVKGSDLGSDGRRLVLDFNFAYSPSCSYDPRWVCPLAPPGNRLPIAIRGGERYPL